MRRGMMLLGVGMVMGLAVWVGWWHGLAAQPAAALPPVHPALTEHTAGQLTALVGSTPQDFYLPGTQPATLEDGIHPADECRACHAGYAEQVGMDESAEIWTAWQGSMMAQSGRDPLFWAALDIANAAVAEVGEWCLRCHTPRGWLEGRSSPVDGSALVEDDLEGVQCAVCHRLVDPVYSADNPARDLEVLSGITPPLTTLGSGALIVDPQDQRRGPFDLQEDWTYNPHPALDWPLVSPYHKEAALCGSCHDISNPLLSWDETTQSYQPNSLDTPAEDLTTLFPIERTFSEWLASDYATVGVEAPAFGGNEPRVYTCQDCHMRAITGAAGYVGEYVLRDDMPLHDLTGANTWIPQTLPLHPVFGAIFSDDPERAEALAYGIERARAMLQNAATLTAAVDGQTLTVTVTNETGHKLPTGYPEGRRMWLQVEAYAVSGELVYQSGAYLEASGDLIADPDLKVYEIKQGLTPDWAAALGLPAGPSFHFALNNAVYEDNRIPPRGYDFTTFAALGAAPHTAGAPDPDRYADGQYWDVTPYTLPQTAAYGVVRLLYQTASKEYITFLRDASPQPDNPNANGPLLYDLWEATGRSQPELMAEVSFRLHGVYLPSVMARP